LCIVCRYIPIYFIRLHSNRFFINEYFYFLFYSHHHHTHKLYHCHLCIYDLILRLALLVPFFIFRVDSHLYLVGIKNWNLIHIITPQQPQKFNLLLQIEYFLLQLLNINTLTLNIKKTWIRLLVQPMHLVWYFMHKSYFISALL